MIANVDIVEVSCANCSFIFFVPRDFDDRRRKDHKSFYCPNGHSNFFSQKTNEEFLRERIAFKDSEISRLEKEVRIAKTVKVKKPRKKKS